MCCPGQAARVVFQAAHVVFQAVGSKGRASTLARLHALGARLKQLAADHPGLGFEAVALFELADFSDEEFVDRQIVESVTGGKLPAIYLNITYDLDRIGPGEPVIDSLLTEYGFKHALTDRRV